MPTGQCPECDADVQVDAKAELQETVDCEECGAELEIVALDPVELKYVEDDPDDDDDEEEVW